MPGDKKKHDEEQESVPTWQEEGENQSVPAPFQNVRRRWHRGEWYYAVVDMIELFTGSLKPYDYWRKMKDRADPGLRAVLSTHILQFKLKAADNRFRLTDTAKPSCALFRISPRNTQRTTWNRSNSG